MLLSPTHGGRGPRAPRRGSGGTPTSSGLWDGRLPGLQPLAVHPLSPREEATPSRPPPRRELLSVTAAHAEREREDAASSWQGTAGGCVEMGRAGPMAAAWGTRPARPPPGRPRHAWLARTALSGSLSHAPGPRSPHRTSVGLERLLLPKAQQTPYGSSVKILGDTEDIMQILSRWQIFTNFY